MDLFGRRDTTPTGKKDHAPLASRLRPERLEEFFGQDHILGEGKFLCSAIYEKKIPSLILWGPPGSGKTTLAKIIARETGAAFLPYSAVLSGIKEIKEAIGKVNQITRSGERQVILFIDEIHRFNKAQQDALLPHVEEGTVTLIGTTTENPSFEIRGPLLSRCKVLILHSLSKDALENIFQRALDHPLYGLGKSGIQATEDVRDFLISSSDGDGRYLINSLEAAAFIASSRNTNLIDQSIAEEGVRKKSLLYDKSGEEHYNLISAFHKSMRGSDPDGTLYWFFRMLKGGEDPLYIARRMIRFASEDIGNADPGALTLSLDAHRAYTILGSPEGELAIVQAALYLASAPKSNRVYRASKDASRDVEETGYHPVPLHLRNAPTKLMKDAGYGKGYRYPHDFQDGFVRDNYFPESLEPRTYYSPTHSGHENNIRNYLEGLWKEKKDYKKGK
jgi:putative ATPase